MDDERFDDLSRVLGKNASRRGALGALAGLAGLVGAGAAEAKSKRRRGKGQGARVNAELELLSCGRLCALLFPFSRQRQAICFQNCECIRRCLAVTDPARQTACFRAILTDPRACAAPALEK